MSKTAKKRFLALGIVLAGSFLVWTARRAAAARASVILISLDTLGAGHLTCFGYARNTSPHLCRFAERSITFTSAFSASARTAESHMSMFTSTFPRVHRVLTTPDPSERRSLSSEMVTLAEVLDQNGYRTVGLHAGGMVQPEFGFDAGFDTYERSEDAIGEGARWLEEHASEGKFFLFLHTYHVHDPYTPGPPFDRMFDPDYRGAIVNEGDKLARIAGSEDWGTYSRVFWSLVDQDNPVDVAHVAALYDGEIAELDSRLRHLFAAIDRYAPEALVVLVSDHGEAFKEHGAFLHDTLYNEIVRVPFLMRRTDLPPGKVDYNVSLIDLAPTILDLVSAAPPDQFQGKPLFTDGVLAQEERVIFSEYGRMRAVIDGTLKLLSKNGELEAYDLSIDPGEQQNLLLDRPELLAEHPRFGALLEELQRQVSMNASLAEKWGPGAELSLSEQTQRQLEALGYVQ